jgi:branched-chain amino acid transport system permease protein
MITVDSIIATIISGLMLGSIYALVSVGLTLQWGAVKILNFAHGAFITLGAYIAWLSLGNLSGGWIIALPMAAIVTFVMGAALERFIMNPMRPKPGGLANITISTLFITIMITNSIILIIGPHFRTIPPIYEQTYYFGPIVANAQQIIIALLGPLSLLLLMLFLSKSKSGMAVRAVALDKDGASLCGINISRSYTYAIGVGAALAGLAGALVGVIYYVTPNMGFDSYIKSLFVITLGGLGRVKGAIYAAYIIGIIEALVAHLFGIFWATPVLFLLFVFFLVVKPRGLYGIEMEL